MGFNTTSIWLKVALICLLVATVLFIIGFATISWMTTTWYRTRTYSAYGSNSYGLWKSDYCERDNCQTYNINSATLEHLGWTGWYRATQVFQCLALICLLLDLLFIILFVFVENIRQRTALIAIIILSFLAVGAMVIGFLIFGLKMPGHYSVDWSMGLAIAACILTFIAGIMAVVDLKK